LIIAHTFLLLASSSLRKNERQFKSLNLLKSLAITTLLGRILEIFIPAVSGPSATIDELPTGFIFDLILTYGVINVLQIILSVGFVIFGLKNRENNGMILVTGGILGILAWSINYTSLSIRSYFQWFIAWNDASAYAAFLEVFMMVIFVAYLLILATYAVVLIYSIKIKEKYFLGYSIIYLLLFLTEFVISFIL
jgi:hypothetical protein